MRAPLMLGWSVGGEACEVARQNRTAYACVSEHRESVNSISGPGCLCNFSTDCQGSSYLSDGCQDIDECKDKVDYPCFGVCTNKPGGYSCVCSPGKQGDPFTDGVCYRENLSLAMKLLIGNIFPFNLRSDAVVPHCRACYSSATTLDDNGCVD